jgi:hypothetical protein
LSDENAVNLPLQLTQLNKMIQTYGTINTIPQPSELVKRSLAAEKTFLLTMNHLAMCLTEKSLLTRGLDNLLAGIEDAHERHVYLLKQRCL